MDRGAEKLQIFLWSALGAFTLAGQLFWEPLFLSQAVPHPLILFPLFLITHVLLVAVLLFRTRFQFLPTLVCIASLALGQWKNGPMVFAFLIWSINGFAP